MVYRRIIAAALALLCISAPAVAQYGSGGGASPFYLVDKTTGLQVGTVTTPIVTSDGSTAPTTGAADAQPTATLGDTNNDRLYVFNGSTWDRARGVPSADGQSLTGILSSGTQLFNGSTWDRARGDTVGGQWVQEKERSLYNSETSTVLASGATFTGVNRDAGGVSGTVPSQWSTFSCYATTNVASATGGFALQQGPDGTNFVTMVSTTLAAGVPAIITSPLFYRYSRCVLTNGATAQGGLAMQSRFGLN